MGDETKLSPCPFCGADIVHVESLARSFDPPRVYHEYRHPESECFLGGDRRFLASFADNPKPRLQFISEWNHRCPSRWEATMGDEHGHDDDEKECIDCQVSLILADVDYEWPEFGAICYGCLLKRYKAAPAPLVWSSERPTKTARYWMRSKGSRVPKDYDCVRLNASEFAPAATWCDDYEFCLIPEPLEKESGG